MPRIFSGRVILYVLILLVLDLAIVPFFRIGVLQPPLGYLLILYAAFQWDIRKAVPTALAVGISRDLVSSQWFGLEMICCVSAAFLLELAVQKIEHTDFAFRAGIAFVFIFLIEILSLLLSNPFAGDTNRFWVGFGTAVGAAAYACVILPAFFYLSARWFRDRPPVKQLELFR
ncbi:MAG TPA: rod shape-determining protein MreD [bacterium]|nr:rod shape-determining protein MreD [bacterium]